MTIVTGATGLVGSYILLQILTDNPDAKVRGLFREINGIEDVRKLFIISDREVLFSKIDWQKTDITNIPSLETIFEDAEYVYHCAGFVSFDRRDEPKLRKTNIEGTANIVNISLAKKVKKLVHVSSIAALGDPKPDELRSEESEWNPESYHSDYAISKFGAEMEVWRAFNEGLSTVILNPGVVLGFHNRFGSSSIIFKNAKKGENYYTNGITAFVAARDVAKIALLAMQSNLVGKRFALVSENLSLKYFLELLADIYKTKPPQTFAKPWLTLFAARLSAFKSSFFGGKPKLTYDLHKSLHSISEVDNRMAKDSFNYKFQDVESTLKEVSKMYDII